MAPTTTTETDTPSTTEILTEAEEKAARARAVREEIEHHTGALGALLRELARLHEQKVAIPLKIEVTGRVEGTRGLTCPTIDPPDAEEMIDVVERELARAARGAVTAGVRAEIKILEIVDLVTRQKEELPPEHRGHGRLNRVSYLDQQIRLLGRPHNDRLHGLVAEAREYAAHLEREDAQP